MKDDKFTLRAVRRANGNYLWRHIKSYFGALSGGPLQTNFLEKFAVGFLTYLLLPLVFAVVVHSPSVCSLSSLLFLSLSLFFPLSFPTSTHIPLFLCPSLCVESVLYFAV